MINQHKSNFNKKFLISNKKIEKSQKYFNIYISGEFTKSKNNFMIFRGYLFDLISKEKILQNLTEKGINYIKTLNGYFCGVFYSKDDDSLCFFNDKLGIFDIFFYFNRETFYISNYFVNIIQQHKFSKKELDIQGIYEFFLFEYPLYGKTFIKNIKLLPIDSYYCLNINDLKLKKKSYYSYTYTFKINIKMKKKEIIEKIDKYLRIGIQNIKKLHSPDITYGLGLSGGMDSRLCADFAKKEKMKLKTFIFGEKKSDAYYISKKIANRLNLKHYELGKNKYFYNYSLRSIKYNPLMNVQYTWYYAIYNKLPNFDVLLTGFHGDDQFGSHLKKSDKNIRNKQEFLNRILHKYCEIGFNEKVNKYFKKSNYFFQSLIKETYNFVKKSKNKKFWQIIEEFNYKNRQRIFIKNNPSLNFYGNYDSFSVFLEPKLINFLMTIPFKYRINQNIYYNYFKKKKPILFNIRPERKISLKFQNSNLGYKILSKIFNFLMKFKIFNKFNNHKDIHYWVSNEVDFFKYIKKFLITNNNPVFNNIVQIYEIKNLLKKIKWNSIEISIIFRLLTIKLFLDEFIIVK